MGDSIGARCQDTIVMLRLSHNLSDNLDWHYYTLTDSDWLVAPG